MNLTPSSLAVVIEPRTTVADAVADCLHARGYGVLMAAPIPGRGVGDRARAGGFFCCRRAAAVLAPGEARLKNPGMAIVIMLSDPNEPTDDAPLMAIRLVKPFDRGDLARATDQAHIVA